MRIFAPEISKNSIGSKRRSCISRSRQGFTLLELMTVVVVIGIMASLSMSLGSNLVNSNRFTQNILTMSGIMEMARQHAITNNTYVWVAFTDTAPEGVYIAAIESKEGTNSLADPTSGVWENTGKKLSDFANLNLLRKAQLIPNLTLKDASTLSVSGMPTATGTVTSLQTIKLVVPVGHIDRTFTRAIQFTPTGAARVFSNSSCVEVGIAPASPSSTSNVNVAVLRLAGITGKLTVYRPN